MFSAGRKDAPHPVFWKGRRGMGRAGAETALLELLKFLEAAFTFAEEEISHRESR